MSSHASETAVQTLLALIRAVMSNSRIALTVSATEKHLHLRETAFGTRAELKALRHLKLRELPQAGIELNPDDLLRREQSKAYKRWLAGAEGTLKRPQLGYTPTSRLTPLFGSSRRQYLAQKLSSVAYLSPSMRELFAHRTAANSFGTIAKSLAISTKRRFISLPINCVFREHRRALRKLHTPYKQAMYSIRAGILRRALRQRRKERAYIDLRQAIRQRRLPREKPKNYRKQQRKQNLRRRFAARRGKYSRRSVRKRTKSSSR
ncbi:MAG: hypothetical protein EOO61_02565 [Hymenobacter sp.]|nr:MAG: hypothetical protein EOO61_02565 [Hymenobacter sp.]